MADNSTFGALAFAADSTDGLDTGSHMIPDLLSINEATAPITQSNLYTHFLQLPNEIQDDIFDLIFGSRVIKFRHDRSLILMYDSSDRSLQKQDTRVATAVQLTCREFYLRARRILYVTNTFIFFEDDHLSRFIRPRYYSHSLVTSVSAELYLDDRKVERPWADAMNRALLSFPDLRRLCVYIYIDHHDYEDGCMGAPDNNEPIIFANVPYRPPRLDDVSVVVVAKNEDWLNYVGIPLTHLFSGERAEAMGTQAAWIQKVTGRLLGYTM